MVYEFSDQSVSGNSKQMAVIKILERKQQAEERLKEKQLELEERRISLEERKMALEEQRMKMYLQGSGLPEY